MKNTGDADDILIGEVSLQSDACSPRLRHHNLSARTARANHYSVRPFGAYFLFLLVNHASPSSLTDSDLRRQLGRLSGTDQLSEKSPRPRPIWLSGIWLSAP